MTNFLFLLLSNFQNYVAIVKTGVAQVRNLFRIGQSGKISGREVKKYLSKREP